MHKLAVYINKKIARFEDGLPRPPGFGVGARFVDFDDYELTVICRGDGFDILHGRRLMTVFSVSPQLMLRLVLFIFWHVWVCTLWCGLKSRLWNWSLHRILRDQK